MYDHALKNKQDLDEAKKRMEAWWRGELLDRPPLLITVSGEDEESPAQNENLEDHFTDPDLVISRMEERTERTRWLGEAIPVMFPVSTGMAAITANYLGCPIRFVSPETTWSDPIVDDWDEVEIEFNPHNKWWRKSRVLLDRACMRSHGSYYVGIPDLNGPAEVLSRMRGPERLAVDTLERPRVLESMMEKANWAWYRYWQAAHGIIHQYHGGYFFWMGLWSEVACTDLQNDFSCMVSEETFDRLFLPYLRQQTEWIPRTIYHLDGPDAVRHLDSLLGLEKLTGIQWVPGAGSPRVSSWMDLLRRIQEAGKLIVVYVEKDEVEPLLESLDPRGLLMQTQCDTVAEGEELLEKARRMC